MWGSTIFPKKRQNRQWGTFTFLPKNKLQIYDLIKNN
jgi:hypothetical protein